LGLAQEIKKDERYQLVNIADAAGNVLSSQTSRINAKPRDITIFDWNQYGFNDILIADGGSGLDIKLNQLTPTTPTTSPTTFLYIKFDYIYVGNTGRIATNTQTDIVIQGNGITPDTVRQTISTFDNTTGNLTNIQIIGSDGSLFTPATTAQTNTSYYSNGQIESVTDANHHITLRLTMPPNIEHQSVNMTL
jgi:hypothetical protein